MWRASLHLMESVPPSVWHDENARALALSYGATELLDKMRLGEELIPAVMKLGSASEFAHEGARACHD
jgi:hypothetical protein